MYDKQKTVKIKDLTISEEITELRPINIYFVSRFRQAMRKGARFPEPVVTKKDNNLVVVSGNHRVTAYENEFGGDYEIEVILRGYSDEASMFEDVARLNIAHGNPLDGFSRRKLAQKLLDFGKTTKEIADVFEVSVKSVERWGTLNVEIIGKNGKKEFRPIKHGMEHLVGRTISEKQYREHEKRDRGITATDQIEQIIRWLDNDQMDRSDGEVVDAIHRLKKSVDQWKKSQEKVS